MNFNNSIKQRLWKLWDLLKSNICSFRSRLFLILTGSVLLVLITLTLLLPASLIKKEGPFSYAVYDKNGRLMGAQVAKDEQWRFEPGAVPPKFAEAIVTFEDKRYYYHLGIDFISIARALKSNTEQGRIVKSCIF